MSKIDEHRLRVKYLCYQLACALKEQGRGHDLSKTISPEKEVFDKPRAKFNSDQYYEFIKENKGIVEHHYARNPHHPEHWPNGIEDMDLVTLAEMLCDWKAASEQDKTGILESLRINKKRYDIPHSIVQLLENTVRRFWP